MCLGFQAQKDSEGLHIAGDWREANFITKGIPRADVFALLPETAKVVMAIKDATNMVHGGSKVSVMEPGTIVRPHTGETNARQRIHLGL